MVFHDAVDTDNLVDTKHNDYSGRSGVDMCLYAPVATEK